MNFYWNIQSIGITAYWFCFSMNTNAFLASGNITLQWRNIYNFSFTTPHICKKPPLGHGIYFICANLSLPLTPFLYVIAPGLFTARLCRARNKSSFAVSIFRGLLLLSLTSEQGPSPELCFDHLPLQLVFQDHLRVPATPTYSLI